MSGADTPQGPGWWQASDGKWYAPDQVSASQPTPTQPMSPVAPMSPMAAGGGGQPGSPGEPGFFGRLFDVSMKSFITPSIIKVLFIIGIVVISLLSIVILIAGTQADGGTILIVLAPLYWFVGVLYLRVVLEVIIVLFRIEENTRGKR